MRLFLFSLFSFLSLHLSSNLCNDPLWCNISPPLTSFYSFSSIINLTQWKEAQILSSSSFPILLSSIIKQFPNNFNFLDGDKTFSNIEQLIDYFIDPKTMFNSITNGFISNNYKKKYASEILKKGKEDEKYIRQNYHNLNYLKRSPILQIGSFRYDSRGKIITVGISAIRSPNRQEFLNEFSPG